MDKRVGWLVGWVRRVWTGDDRIHGLYLCKQLVWVFAMTGRLIIVLC